MKIFIKNLFLLPTLIAGLVFTPARRVTAQTFTVLHSFSVSSDYPSYTNSDGAFPNGLIISSNTLYGTTYHGGITGNGTVFAVHTDGTGFTNLYTFTALVPSYNANDGTGVYYTNSDGAYPFAALILSGNTLYGTAFQGGTTANGTVFAVHTDGTGFSNLHTFTAFARSNSSNADGFSPRGRLFLSGNTLYGTAEAGGSSDNGTVFKVNTDGTGFARIHNFTAIHGPYNGPYSNSDGAYPVAGLILSGDTLYGTAEGGGNPGNGAVFAVNRNGTDFTTLHSFTATSNTYPNPNSDGAFPEAGLILSSNTLYGTTRQGGSSGLGTVFAVNTNGTDFSNLYNFTGGSDGANPSAGLVLSGNTLYGAASGSGSDGYGTLFAVNTDGTGFTNLYTFSNGSDGVNPSTALILSGNTLYGTASGGSSGSGTVFSLSFRPQLTVTLSGASVILSWPTNVAGFDYTGYTLQSTTNLVSPAVWSANSPVPVVVNGQNTVIIPMSGAQKFYRLSQ